VVVGLVQRPLLPQEQKEQLQVFHQFQFKAGALAEEILKLVEVEDRAGALDQVVRFLEQLVQLKQMKVLRVRQE
jgi:hypothetical protein